MVQVILERYVFCGRRICDKVFVDNEGRMLIVKVIVNNNFYYLVNIYASNVASEREIFKILFQTIHSFNIYTNMIIAGDFNAPL